MYGSGRLVLHALQPTLKTTGLPVLNGLYAVT